MIALRPFPYSEILQLIGTFLLISSTILAQTPIVSPKNDNVPKELVSQLLGIAEEAITTQYQILVNGDIEGSLKNKKLAHLYREGMSDKFSFQAFRRNKLKETKQDYKDFNIRLEVKVTSKENNKILLKATEYVVLKLNVPDGPDTTEYKQDHLFEFSYQGQEWELVKDSILRPQLSPINNPNPLPTENAPMTPTINAPAGYRSRNFQEKRMDEQSLGAHFFRTAFSPLPILNHQAAANYARQYALIYNPAYYRFNNDCTNFASQAMLAGGWQMVGFGAGFGRTNPDNWYYSCISSATGRPIASYSWGAAYNFNVFILRANRVQHVTYFQDLQPGDLVFADWDTINGPHLPDGRVDHAMIVTTKDVNGNIYVSYHTNDTKDRAITDIIMHEPSANFFGDIVY